ncbi:non-ribosomal peptide synthetase [Nocardia arthritidis]|uniref:Amino acid adenylation domain-containing protein n=1 Tax=Nocardia arthritidis TaxID=228602 RepID=A0A6G9Y9I1_9NOCA|nr:non-ribosomal peptide synthetase [Nocardia arthritidis]QIS09871.1 amino acid adenylation domain-containing protein [Nocardia arthritidis]
MLDRKMFVMPLSSEARAGCAILAQTNGCDETIVLAAAVCSVIFRHTREEDFVVSGRVMRITDKTRFRDLLLPGPTGCAGRVVDVRLVHETGELYVTAEDGAAWQSSFDSLLRHATAEPDCPVGSLRLLSPEEIKRAFAEIQADVAPGSNPEVLHAPFERLARDYPERSALITSGTTLSYGQLNERADRFAAHLVRLGAGPDTPVGVLVERSAELVVALLGALKCGAPFIPLDRRMPFARVQDVLRAAGTHLLIDRDAVLAGTSVESPPCDTTVTPAHPAYMYFTSGSTGTPKGVVIDHRCAALRVDWIVSRYGLSRDSIVLHKCPLIFDVAVIEIMAPLNSGAACRIAEPDTEADVERLAGLLQNGDVTFVHFVPSMLKTFLAGVGDMKFPAVRWVQTSGEAMPARLLDQVKECFGNAEFHSVYGQTETSEVACWSGTDKSGQLEVPIGRQVGVYRLYVLDEALNPVPPGVQGEICIAGVGGLARGYHNQPALTAERFVPHPQPLVSGERLYRTGDLGVLDATGEILFRGRADTQAKIRGARVEPVEVEAMLAQAPRVRDCAVVVVQDGHGDNELVAYVVGDKLSRDELDAWLVARLPSYMVPAVYMLMDSLPMTGSGKLDRSALPAPTPADRGARSTSGEARTQLEAELSALVAFVLGVPEVGRTDGFFAIGGTSLNATRVLVRINALFGVTVDVADFFADPTVRGLAAQVERGLFELVSSLTEAEAAQRLAELDSAAGETR